MNTGQKLVSDAFEPKGDYNSDVSMEDIKYKVYKMNRLYAENDVIDPFVDAVLNTKPEESFSKVFNAIKILSITNIHPEIKFI